ncbi:MAG: mechanosensitive ion channel [Bacteroidia bacterium]|nr:mechanosensitive ion channel [Bacteroidia bacterium]
MDQFRSFVEYVLISYEGYELKVAQVLWVIGIVLGTWILLRFGKWFMKGRFLLVRKLAASSKARHRGLWAYRIFLVGGAILLGLDVLGIKLSELLNFTVLPLGNEKSIRVGNVIFGIVLLLLTRYLVTNFHRFFIEQGKAKRLTMDQGRRMAIYQIFQYLAYLLAVIVIISSLDVDLRAILVGSAALFVGLGLALQNTFADILSGVLILFDGTIEVGDWLVIKGRNIEGEVKEIRLRTTIIETLDSSSIIVPNRMFSDSDILNWSYNDRETRFSVDVGVAYGSNLQQVRKVLKSCAENHGRVMKNPEPKVLFINFGESSLDFQLVYWLEDFKDHQSVESDIRFMIDSDFRRNNITIPFPQRDLHIITDATLPEELIEVQEEEERKIP